MKTKSKQRRCRAFSIGKLQLIVSACFLLMVSGCGNLDVGYVSGTVTLDAAPVKSAVVAFNPAEGRGSSGITDQQGRYELRYVADQDGALIGNHKVTISTKTYGKEGTLDDDTGTFSGGIKAKKETIPKRYSDYRKTTLTAEVKSGQNDCNFELTSKK